MNPSIKYIGKKKTKRKRVEEETQHDEEEDTTVEERETMYEEERKRQYPKDQLLVIHFSASWAPQCEQMDQVLEELSEDPSLDNVSYYKLEAESLPDAAVKYNVSAVPTIILIKNQTVVDRSDGANAPDLQKKVRQRSGEFVPQPVSITRPPVVEKQNLETRLKALINLSACMLFMKGNPDQPKCGFSRQIVQILNDHNAKFGHFDILTDNEIREGLKKFSEWPTYPQLYINSDLVGGIDIIKEMVESGEFDSMVPKK
ncbi:Glutaredoxin-3 [Nymphon striatum]|nr:Glutaredoxin-3 [Nymphon striatum]